MKKWLWMLTGGYLAGALIMLMLSLSNGATWDQWPQIALVSLGWPAMLALLIIFVVASIGAPG